MKNNKNEIKYFYEQRKVDPKDYTNKRLGKISILNKEYEKAIQYLNESLKLNPIDDEVLYNLAFAYAEIKNYNSANEFVKKCLQINPLNKNGLKLQSRLNKN